MITLTAHLENGKKYQFEIPEGYPWVEYDGRGRVFVWDREPVLSYDNFNYYPNDPINDHVYAVGRIPECSGCEPQLQRIQFHD